MGMQHAGCSAGQSQAAGPLLLLWLLFLAALAAVPCHAAEATTEASARDYYEVLGIERGASPAEVKRAYKQMALRYHPDKNKAIDAAGIFIELQKAYEVLSDPERRRKYDTRSRFFSSEEHEEEQDGAEGSADAPDFGRGVVFDSEDRVKEAINSDSLWLFHVYVDSHTLFGDWMRQLHPEFQLGHLNLDRCRELASALRAMHGGRLSTVPFLMVCLHGRCRSFTPSMGGFFFAFRSVSADVTEQALQLVDYWEHLAGPRSDEELQHFAEFHPGGSARLRVLLLVDSEDERHFGVYAASKRLCRVAQFAQMHYFDAVNMHGEPGDFLASLQVTRLPSVVLIDPAGGGRSTTMAGMRTLDAIASSIERLLSGERLSSRLFPIQELDADTFSWRCGGSLAAGDTSCDFVVVLGTPPPLESNGAELSAVLSGFGNACESLLALGRHMGRKAACFWLRLGRAPAWEAAFRETTHDIGAHVVAVVAGGKVALAPQESMQSSRAIFKWLRETVGPRGLHGPSVFTPKDWPALPKALGPGEEADYGFSWTRAVRRQVRALTHAVSASISWSMHAVVVFVRSADPVTFYGFLFLACSAVLWYWYFINDDGTSALPSIDEVIGSMQFQLTVHLRRENSERLGFGIRGHKQGGLEITNVAKGGLLEGWNDGIGRQERRVREGDCIICIGWCEEGRQICCSASHGADAMAKVLKGAKSTDVVLTVLPGMSATCGLQSLESTITLPGLRLQDCGRFAFGLAPDGTPRLDLEVVGTEEPLREWNDQRLREGAACTQKLEPGDRVVAIKGHVDVQNHLTDVSPTIIIVKWRPENDLHSQRYHFSLKRADVTEPWGMQLCMHPFRGQKRIFVKKLLDSGPVPKRNASAMAEPGCLPVLPGDCLLSANGHEALQQMTEELRKLEVELIFERWFDDIPGPVGLPQSAPVPAGTAEEWESAADNHAVQQGQVAGAEEPPRDGWDLDLGDDFCEQGHGAVAATLSPAVAAEEAPALVATGSVAARAAAPKPVGPPPELVVGDEADGWDVMDLKELELPPSPLQPPSCSAATAAALAAPSLAGLSGRGRGQLSSMRVEATSGLAPSTSCKAAAANDDRDISWSGSGTALPQECARTAAVFGAGAPIVEPAGPSRPMVLAPPVGGQAAAEEASGHNQAEGCRPSFASLDTTGAWLQSSGICVLASRGSPAFLESVTALHDVFRTSETSIAFFYEQRLPSDSLLIVLPRESRCRWFCWRVPGALLEGGQVGPEAKARQLLERLCGAAHGAGGEPPQPLLPLCFEPADFARRAFGSCLARSAGHRCH